MALFGWDWGNVPSWFSAASFSAAAFVIWRDRMIRVRQQVDQVSVWGNGFAAQEVDEHLFDGYYVTVDIRVKNSGALAVHVSNICYLVVGYWAEVDEDNSILEEYRSDPVRIEGAAEGATVPPGETIRAYDRAVRDVEKDRPRPAAVTGMGVPGSSVLVTQYLVIDSHGNGWRVRPTSGKPPKRLRRYRK
ncbi:hypothetical protein L3Q67_01290 [Saccharothrix sp. AJ9571]|nr:hypothetical protein L3Q67_01290 [Saccharothrix sp. AJ9571]